ncbi:MAG: isoprenylcysteine carboxylmethyltransferase family protein [Anaerolineales bacterium]
MKLLLKNILFTLVVPGSVGVYFPFALTRGLSAKAGLTVPIAFVLFAAAFAVYLWSVWGFGSRGQGTPFPTDAPKRLVIEGPYLYTRNPMYLALFCALIGWLLLFPTAGLLVYALAVAVAVRLFVVRYEEPHLEHEFGDEYKTYKVTVPRWLPAEPRPVLKKPP